MEGDFQLGPWLVRPNLNSATCNGTSNRLTPKAMEVLVCLAQQAGDDPLEAVADEERHQAEEMEEER